MTLLLALGFAVVAASGTVLRHRGRRTAATVLITTATTCLAIAALTGGRDGISQYILGWTIGLPVLIAGAAARNRAEKTARPQAAPTPQ